MVDVVSAQHKSRCETGEQGVFSTRRDSPKVCRLQGKEERQRLREVGVRQQVSPTSRSRRKNVAQLDGPLMSSSIIWQNGTAGGCHFADFWPLVAEKVYVYRSTDYGTTWEDISEGIPGGPVNVIREDPFSKQVLYVGTDLGVYVTTDAAETWSVLCDCRMRRDALWHILLGQLPDSRTAAWSRTVYATASANLQAGKGMSFLQVDRAARAIPSWSPW